VHTAISGEEGLEILNNEDIALVITDQRMPRMTGVQFLQSLPEEKM
jgi:YesN/AraC family two-component response regulator